VTKDDRSFVHIRQSQKVLCQTGNALHYSLSFKLHTWNNHSKTWNFTWDTYNKHCWNMVEIWKPQISPLARSLVLGNSVTLYVNGTNTKKNIIFP